LPRVTGTYTGTHTGRFGFVTLNAVASFRILGCPSTTPDNPPPCITTTTTTTTTTTPSGTDSVSVSDSSDSDSVSVDSDDNDVDFGGDSDDDGGSNGYNFFNFNFGGDSDDAEAKVGDSDDLSDSSEDPDNGPTCLPQPIILIGGGSSASDSKESASDSFDVEAAIGVQTHSLSHAVFEDRVLYLLASIGIAASLIVMYRLFCMKEDYEVVAEPELEEL